MRKQAEYFRMVSIAESLVRSGLLEKSTLETLLTDQENRKISLEERAREVDELVTPILEHSANDQTAPPSGDVAA